MKFSKEKVTKGKSKCIKIRFIKILVLDAKLIYNVYVGLWTTIAFLLLRLVLP